MKREGFWYSEHEPDLPMPVPGELTPGQALEIYNLIRKKEKQANKTAYRGHSKSRIDNTVVGSQEYSTSEWKWPDGFASHYVLQHLVKPSDEFLDFIGYTEQTDATKNDDNEDND